MFRKELFMLNNQNNKIDKVINMAECKRIVIDKIHIKEGVIKVVINKEGNDSFYNLKEDLYVVMVNEGQKVYYQECVKVDLENEVHIMMSMEEWALKSNSISGFYDVYIKSENQLFTMELQYEDGLSIERGLSLPRIVVIDKEGMKFSIKTYCGKNNILAIKISKLIEIKNINSAEIKKGNIQINGVVYIRRAYKVKEDKMYGKVELENELGEKRVFNYAADVVLRENANVQYDYVMTIDKDDIKSQGYSAREVLCLLSKNVAKCSIDGVDGKVEYTMDIKQQDLILTFKDKMKKNRIKILEMLKIK